MNRHFMTGCMESGFTQKKLKRKWYVCVGGYYATGKTKKAAYKKAKKLYDERFIEK